jgi:hypothetical protein
MGTKEMRVRNELLLRPSEKLMRLAQEWRAKVEKRGWTAKMRKGLAARWLSKTIEDIKLEEKIKVAIFEPLNTIAISTYANINLN